MTGLVFRVWWLALRVSKKVSTLWAVVRYGILMEVRGGGSTIEWQFSMRPFPRYGRLRLVLMGDNVIGAGTRVQGGGTVTFGRGSYCGTHCVIGAIQSVRIGEGVMIASHVSIRDSDHALEADARQSGELVVSPVRVDDGAWIGSGVAVLKGVTIGARAVVGAGAVVTRDVPPGAVVAGVPARIVREPRDG